MTQKKDQVQQTVVAYKAFNKDLTCRDFHFEVGKTYEHKGKVEACSSGFHACENPMDTWSYYDLTDSRFCVVEMSGEVSRHSDDSKIAAARITIKAELSLPQIITDAIKLVMNVAKNADSDETASGNYSKLAASGNYSKLAASGNYSNLAASGNYSKLAASGKKSIAVASGVDSQASAGEDGCIALAWWDKKAERYRMEVAYVGEDGIEPNVAYKLGDNHKFVKA